MGSVARNHAEPEQSEDQGLEQGIPPVEPERNADKEQKKQGGETL